MHRVLISATLVICVLASIAAAEVPVRPPGEGPVPVHVGVYVIDISDLDESRGTFQTELDVVGGWHDARLAFDADEAGVDEKIYFGPTADELRKSIWTAQITVVNILGELKLGSIRYIVRADGEVVVRARVTATLRAPLNFRDFPFDKQLLPIRLESFSWDDSVVELKPIEDRTGFDPAFEMAEWDVVDVATVTSSESRSGRSSVYSRLAFNVTVHRKSGFYVWKALLPLLVIVSISWVVFWMSNEGLGRRAGVSSTGILTVIAYQFIVSESLPRVAYLTIMDKIMVASVTTIAATMLVNIAVDRLAVKHPARSHSVDVICRWAFPVIYYGLLAGLLVPQLQNMN